jgi:hypothetical protein
LQAKDDLDLLDYYASWLNIKQELEFYQDPLNDLGIPSKN